MLKENLEVFDPSEEYIGLLTYFYLYIYKGNYEEDSLNECSEDFEE